MAATHLAVYLFLSPAASLAFFFVCVDLFDYCAAPIFFLARTPFFRPTIPANAGMQGIEMTGALGRTSSVRRGVPALPFIPSQSTQTPQIIPSSQSPASQNFQGHGMLRASSLGSSASQSPSSVQGTQTQYQPWLSSGTQGKPPLPPPSIRLQATPQSFQQRPHITQQHHSMPTTSHKQTINSGQQVAQPSGQQQEHHGQQLPSSRIQPPSSHQQQLTKSPGLGVQRPPLGMAQSGALESAVLLKTATLETEEVPNTVVSERSIQELVNQIDLSEKLDPQVEDILVDLAEDFVESVDYNIWLFFGQTSSTLEAKDILLHLERNWNDYSWIWWRSDQGLQETVFQ